MQKSKPFKFFRVVTPHVRKLEARANRKIIFYGMRPKFGGLVYTANLWQKCATSAMNIAISL